MLCGWVGASRGRQPNTPLAKSSSFKNLVQVELAVLGFVQLTVEFWGNHSNDSASDSAQESGPTRSDDMWMKPFEAIVMPEHGRQGR